MIKKTRYFFLLVFVISFHTKQIAAQTLNVFAMDRTVLPINKQKLKSKDASLMISYEALLKNANAIISKRQPVSVMEKKDFPPSGSKHDYMSIAIYFWPDPNKKDGLPYIRRDGEINPETKNYADKENMIIMTDCVETIALAYYFSDDEQYAQKAADFLKVWFIDTATRMNPNLNFAQAIKGKNDGRGAGLIESRILINLVDAIGLIEHSSAWKPTYHDAMQKWFSDFLNWFVTSKNGIEEFKAKNNHGVWYDVQKLSYALFTQHHEIAAETIESLKKRLETQMDDDGFFPAEMERTISLHYEAFILDPFFMGANMSQTMQVDLWNYQSSTGKSIRKGFDVLVPYLTKEKEWTGQQIKPFEFKKYAIPLLAKAYYKYQCDSCRTAISKIDPSNQSKNIIHLITSID